MFSRPLSFSLYLPLFSRVSSSFFFYVCVPTSLVLFIFLCLCPSSLVFFLFLCLSSLFMNAIRFTEQFPLFYNYKIMADCSPCSSHSISPDLRGQTFMVRVSCSCMPVCLISAKYCICILLTRLVGIMHIHAHRSHPSIKFLGTQSVQSNSNQPLGIFYTHFFH